MGRWRALGVLVMGAALAAAGAPAAAADPPAAAAGAPNVLLVLLDDARAGSTDVMTKTQAWLRDGGTSFANAVATTPSCCPSRASLLSGRYAHNTGVVQQAGIGNLDHARTVQHDLKAAGYRTAAVGKLFNKWPLGTRPPHFDNWALTGGGYNNAGFVVDGKWRRAPYSTTFIGAQINRYVDAYETDDSRPWFIYAGFTAPHSPYTPEPRYADRSFQWGGNPATKETDRSDKPAYVRNYRFDEQQGAQRRRDQLRTLLSVDDALDAVRRNLQARGELTNTLVILTSDNGMFWGEHRLQGKFMPYDPAVRVPLHLWWPGRVAAGATDGRLAGVVDVGPTVLAAAGVAPSYQTDGRSLFPAWNRERILLEYWRDEANSKGIPTWASTLAPGRSWYTEYYDGGGTRVDREYYDLAADPWQLTNLLRDGNPGNDPALGALQSQLAALRTCTGPACG